VFTERLTIWFATIIKLFHTLTKLPQPAIKKLQAMKTIKRTLFFILRRTQRIFSSNVLTGIALLYKFLAILAVVSYISSFASSMAPNNSFSALLSSESVDLENAVKKASVTTPWSDNGWRAYGPLLYKITNYGASFAKSVHNPHSAISSKQQHELKHHFFLTMIAPLSALGVGFVIAVAIVKDLPSRLLLASIIGTSLFKSQFWYRELFLVHPDVLLAPVTALYAYTLISGTSRHNMQDKIRKTAALVGVGLATKMTFILFLPTLIVAFAEKNIYRVFSRLCVVMLLAFTVYILVGFPQSLGMYGVIKFLISQSGYAASVNYDSITTWASILTQDTFVIIPIILCAVVFFTEPNRKRCVTTRSKTSFLKLITLTLLPASLLVSTVNFVPEFFPRTLHYSVAFVSYTSTGIASLAVILFSEFYMKLANYSVSLSSKSFVHAKRVVGSILLVTICYLWGVGAPETVNINAKQNLQSRSELSKIIHYSNSIDNMGAQIFISPYFPNSDFTDQIGININSTKEFFRANGAISNTALLIDWKWYSRFLEQKPSKYDLNGLGSKEWYFSKNFYESLFQAGKINNFGTFIKFYSSGTSEIWVTPDIMDKIAKLE